MRTCALGWVLGRSAFRKPIHGFVRPPKWAVSPGVLLLLLRPGSDVSILLPWGRRRALALVRVVVSALWRDDA